MNSEIPLKSYERDIKTRVAVDQLRVLLLEIYPDPSPDIFTLDDFINRYPLTGLGELATREIEQSQRINMSINDYAQIALCDFHIGLIFLYWGDFRGAINQFGSARKKWSFSGPTPTSSLCYFARGVCNSLVLHYEEALRCFGLAARALEQVDVQRYESFHQEIAEYIHDYQVATRNAIWARMRIKSQPDEPPDTGQPEQSVPTEQPVSAEPVNQMAANEYVHSPTFSEQIITEDIDDALVDDQPTEVVPMPQTHLPLSTEVPIPGHYQSNENYAWYQVASRPENQLYGEINDGDWLLVQDLSVMGTTVHTDEPILVSMQEDLGNAIHIRPDNATRPYQRIYLAKYDDLVGTFKRDPETGKVTFLSQESTIKVTFSSQDRQISVQWSAIVGIVVGLWRSSPNGLAPINLDEHNL